MMRRLQWLSSVTELVLIGGLVMFASMAAGELFISKDMFGGFLNEPESWIWIFVESAIWLLPFSILGLFVLSRSQNRSTGRLFVRSAVVWFLLGATIVATYKIFYFPENLNLREHGMELLFGWVIPCAIIWMFFTGLSLKYFRRIPER